MKEPPSIDSGQAAGEQYDWSTDTEASIAVIEAVAMSTGRDPTDLAPLGEYLDPDALDALFTDSSGRPRVDITVSFSYEEQYVTVRGDGHILVQSE